MILSTSLTRFSSSEIIKDFFSRYFATVTAGAFLLLSFFSSEVFSFVSLVFLVAGFIFPGMAHGSLDLHLMKRCVKGSTAFVLSVYVFAVVSIVCTWYFAPVFVFLLFLGNSAFHFGETDLRYLSGANRLTQLVYGSALLLFMFITHLTETRNYISAFNITVPQLQLHTWVIITTLCSGVLVAGLALSSSKPHLVNALLVLLIGTQLPLLLAFGVYYILIHSRTSWKAISNGLGLRNAEMVMMAAPFTIAGLFIMFIAYLFFNRYSLLSGEPVALISVGLAAITLPHTVAMTLFYSKNKSAS